MREAINRHLETLALKDPDERRLALAGVLDKEGLSYTIQQEDPSPKNARGTVNYLVSAGQETPCFLFCAHYDGVPGSFGANDNAAAVCILIDLAKTLSQQGISARFGFFDGEENGNSGSRLYVSQLDRSSLTGVINLDVCGYGDTLAICGKGHEKKPVMRPFCQKALLEKYNGKLLKYLPPSDDASFARNKIPVLSMAMVPRWDIQYLKTLATYGEGLLCRPPEFEMILGQMEVITTMHGGYRDTPEWVEPDTMERMYSYLLEALTAPQQPSKKWFHLF